MRKLSFVIGLALCAAFAFSAAAASKPPAAQALTVAQLQQVLSGAQSKNDAGIAQQLAAVELTERMSSSLLARLSATLPGDKSREALLLLADKSAFLDPPASAIVSAPTPDAAATRQMLVQIVNYVNTTLRQLPNLLVSRETIGFEDRPQAENLEATGIVSLSYLPLHVVGKSTDTITFRDRKELVEDSGKSKKEGRVGGMVTTGEFGPILSTVLADALKGKITWGHWEQGSAGRVAVFNYEVPENKSNYRVEFCCILNGMTSGGQPDLQLFNERAAYRGQIAFNPGDGSILRMSLRAELPPHGLVSNAGLVVDYAPTGIAGKTYFCPSKSISILEAHTAQPHGMYSQADYRGPTKTFLNDMAFGHYRRFGSEARILTGENQPPQ